MVQTIRLAQEGEEHALDHAAYKGIGQVRTDSEPPARSHMVTGGKDSLSGVPAWSECPGNNGLSMRY